MVGTTAGVGALWAATDEARAIDIGTAVCAACGATLLPGVDAGVGIAVGATAGAVVGIINCVALAAGVAAALPTGLVAIGVASGPGAIFWNVRGFSPSAKARIAPPTRIASNIPTNSCPG